MADKTIAIEIKVDGLDNVRLSTNELDKLAAVRARNRKESQDTAKAITAEAGSMAQLRAETSLLIQKANQLNTATKEGAKEFNALQKQIVQNKEKIRDFDRQLSGSTTLVGEYERGFTGAFKNMGVSILAMGGLIAGATGAFKVLSEAIKDNEAVSEFLDRKVGGLGASFDVLKGKVLGFFESLIKSDNEDAIKWGNGLRNVLSSISMGFSELIPGVRSLGDEMNEAAKANELIIKRQQDLDDMEGERILRRSEANRKLAEAKLKGEGSKEALEIEKQILQEEIDYQQKIIDNQIAINELKKKSGVYDEGREGLALKREQAKLNDLQTESFIRQRKAEATANKEELKTVKDIAKEKEEREKKDKEYFDAEMMRLKDAEDALLRDIQFRFDIEDKLAEEKEKRRKESDDRLFEEAQERIDAIVEAESAGEQKANELKKMELFKFLQAKRRIESRYRRQATAEEIKDEIDKLDQKRRINEAYTAAISSLLGNISGLVESNKQKELSAAGDNAKKREAIEKEYAKKQQAIAYAQATINAAKGITSIWATWAWNPIVAGILTALETAATAIQLKIIASQKFAKGGLLYGPSHEHGGIPIRVNGQSGYEAEGGEAIINKRSTSKYKALLSRINEDGGGKKFAAGGLIPEQSNFTSIDLNKMSMMIARNMSSIKVINSVGEFRKADAIYAESNTRSSL